jgi:hypothetical protein
MLVDMADWSAVQPLEFLTPFLKLVREPEVSGPITGVALAALCRLLSAGAVGELQQPVLPASRCRKKSDSSARWPNSSNCLWQWQLTDIEH